MNRRCFDVLLEVRQPSIALRNLSQSRRNPRGIVWNYAPYSRAPIARIASPIASLTYQGFCPRPPRSLIRILSAFIHTSPEDHCLAAHCHWREIRVHSFELRIPLLPHADVRALGLRSMLAFRPARACLDIALPLIMSISRLTKDASMLNIALGVDLGCAWRVQ